jgi:cytoskeleton protein RodZ
LVETKPTPTPISLSPTPSPTPTPALAAKTAPVVATQPTATPSVTPIASPSPSPLAVKPVEVIVEALSKVDIKFSFDGEKWDSLSLQPDQLHTFKSKIGLKLEISDGGAVSLIVNGRERGVPGSIGKPIKLSYPK